MNGRRKKKCRHKGEHYRLGYQKIRLLLNHTKTPAFCRKLYFFIMCIYLAHQNSTPKPFLYSVYLCCLPRSGLLLVKSSLKASTDTESEPETDNHATTMPNNMPTADVTKLNSHNVVVFLKSLFPEPIYFKKVVTLFVRGTSSLGPKNDVETLHKVIFNLRTFNS